MGGVREGGSLQRGGGELVVPAGGNGGGGGLAALEMEAGTNYFSGDGDKVPKWCRN